MKINHFLCSAALVALASCGSDRGLRDLGSTGAGPDEFAVQTALPLVLPQNFNVLPEPTPGGFNTADRTPRSDAVVAMGGRPGAAIAGGVPQGDAALVAHAGRGGVDPAIRLTLAQADAAFRSGRGGGGLFGRRADRYFRVYAQQALDAYAELDRFRAAGVATPTAPPQ